MSNRIILENFAPARGAHHAVRVRVPLIPGINDDAANLEAIGAFARVARRDATSICCRITRPAPRSTQRLGRAYPLPTLAPPSPDALDARRGSVSSASASTVHIGG